MKEQATAQEAKPGRSYRAQVVLAFIPVALLHIAGFGLFFFLVEPLHLQLGSSVFGVGIAVVAYVLGVRHAFDADHIAAIDNTTRKLVDLRRPAAGVGLFFSLGHSTIVFLMAALLALGVSWAVGLSDDGNDVRNGLGVFGTLVSGVFLLLIGLINAVAFMGILKVWRASRSGDLDELELERHLEGRGLISRLIRPMLKTIDRPGKMYAVGFLFGLGFDTASEIALLVLAGTGAATGLPWYAILCLPLIFAAGMSLFDTLDSAVMVKAYGWASVNAVRKLYYNLTITGLSVVIAVMIGGIELVGLLNEKLGLRDPLTGWVASIDLENVGYIVVGTLILVWFTSTAYWRFGHVEERWALASSGAGANGDAAARGEPGPGAKAKRETATGAPRNDAPGKDMT
ncbi:HoxN/HupN/NixA family nickel/cobalt transporter [Arthrobacter gengyunqii]|uniref:Nickel/cobalt efflux system n=1 Tax=Arthrobacter gengyunqii TaxID=2886940 RepID=A0A9X1M384_9MICC|nr:HoxN/HupN/NixA family nickel/cobalt transporter [Arthrobacter gengyunqii]MCC3270534.1 HoxN/HupN/NixA family nickel/cobalt transporter [Arthrobacter gengyunqii]UOY97418.1 HoxN/HupN/NixA family nickel/cobalt transporter [Arthrobacter gengyunqii]